MMSVPASAVDAEGPALPARSRLEPSLLVRVAAWALPVEIALVTVAIFLPVLRAAWVDWDDPINFLLNPHYRGLGWSQLRWMLTANVMGHWIPTTWLTLGADYALWGMKPFGYHLTSLLLHAASAAVFYLVARRLLALAVPAASALVASAGATAAALVFAIHPLRVESVAWITERRDVTSGLFFLLTLLAYLRAHERPPAVRSGWRWAALAFAALALTSKSIVMGLPLVLVILDVYPLRRLGPRLRDWMAAAAWPIWREKIPFMLLAAATGAAAFLVQRSTGYLTDAEPAARVVMVFHNVWFHAWKTFVPLDLAPIYELPSRLSLLEKRYLLSAAGSVATTAVVWLLRKRWPAGLATWAFYLVMLAPVSGIVHTGNHLGADRNTYVPCAGFALLVGALVVGAVEARRRGWLGTPVAALVVALVASWIVGLGFATRIQTGVWHDSETLWRYTLEVEPTCSICSHNLAVILGERGDQAEALALFERALALRPDRSDFYSSYGVLLLQMGRRPDGLAALRYRIARAPGDFSARTNLGIALIEDGHLAAAIAQLEQALRIKPDSVPALDALGRALLTDGRVDAAMAAFERALAVDPNDSVGRLGTARVSLARGDRAAARAQFEILRARDPNLALRVEQEFR
ncbi:MAG TPA: tetratricopeptide repeat protein [Methylomirabilota bacterium]|nr:tetratricopeptide repeat protein [Methylomirabilota bacterium]